MGAADGTDISTERTMPISRTGSINTDRRLLLARRQLHAGRSVFLLQYDWWPAEQVSSASVLAQWRRNLQDFRNAECDLVGPIYRGGICTLNFHLSLGWRA